MSNHPDLEPPGPRCGSKRSGSVPGMSAGLVYFFRVQILLPAGEQNSCQVVSLLVA